MATNIIPLTSSLDSLTQIRREASAPPKEQSAQNFGDIFKQAVENAEQLDAVRQEDLRALAVGEVDNIAQINLTAEKAQVAVQLMVQMRNKLLESYQEIMRMNV